MTIISSGASFESMARWIECPEPVPVNLVTFYEETRFSGDFSGLIRRRRRRMEEESAECVAFMDVLFPGWPTNSADIPNDVDVECIEVVIEVDEAILKWKMISANEAAMEQIETVVAGKVDGRFEITIVGQTVQVTVKPTARAAREIDDGGTASSGEWLDDNWWVILLLIVVLLLVAALAVVLHQRRQEATVDRRISIEMEPTGENTGFLNELRRREISRSKREKAKLMRMREISQRESEMIARQVEESNDAREDIFLWGYRLTWLRKREMSHMDDNKNTRNITKNDQKKKRNAVKSENKLLRKLKNKLRNKSEKPSESESKNKPESKSENKLDRPSENKLEKKPENKPENKSEIESESKSNVELEIEAENVSAINRTGDFDGRKLKIESTIAEFLVSNPPPNANSNRPSKDPSNQPNTSKSSEKSEVSPNADEKQLADSEDALKDSEDAVKYDKDAVKDSKDAVKDSKDALKDDEDAPDTITTVSSIEEAQQLNVPNKEVYLTDSMFLETFKMTKIDFQALKPWKQVQLKRNAGLF